MKLDYICWKTFSYFLVASWIAEDFDFAKIISSDKNTGVVGTSTGVDVCTICSLRPNAQGVEG